MHREEADANNKVANPVEAAGDTRRGGPHISIEKFGHVEPRNRARANGEEGNKAHREDDRQSSSRKRRHVEHESEEKRAQEHSTAAGHHQDAPPGAVDGGCGYLCHDDIHAIHETRSEQR